VTVNLYKFRKHGAETHVSVTSLTTNLKVLGTKFSCKFFLFAEFVDGVYPEKINDVLHSDQIGKESPRNLDRQVIQRGITNVTLMGKL
jgi:hypothetical protein